MDRKIVVNGVEYDSPGDMPPEVRRLYEQALERMRDLGKGTGPGETKTVTSRPGGVSIEIPTSRVHYNIDGKTYDDQATLPREVRERVERALGEATHVELREQAPRTEVRVINVPGDVPVEARLQRIVLWVLLVVAVAIVIWSVL